MAVHLECHGVNEWEAYCDSLFNVSEEGESEAEALSRLRKTLLEYRSNIDADLRKLQELEQAEGGE